MNEERKLAIKAKVEKEHPQFVDGLNGANLEALEKSLTIYAKYREEAELGRQEDEELLRAKEHAKELARPYNEAIKALKEKLAYINVLIDERKAADGL